MMWVVLSAALAVEPPASRKFVNPMGRLNLGRAEHLTAGLALADLDSDGDLEAIVANGRHWAEENHVFYLSGGGYTVGRPLGGVLSTSYAVQPIDLDRDGDLDLITGNDMAANRTFRNDGTGRFTEWGTFGEPEAPTRDLLVVDVDEDGIDDVVILNRGAPDELCFGGSIPLIRCVALPGAAPTLDAAAADLDGDGHVDLILAHREGQPNLVRFGDGRGGFDRTRALPGKGGDTRAIAVGDIDQDGHIDVIAGNLDGPNLIYLGTGQGQLAPPLPLGDETDATHDLAVVDLDLDGDLDIVAANVHGPSAAWFNEAGAQQWRPVPLEQVGYDSYAVAVGLLNDDPWPDVVLGRSGDVNAVYINVPASP